MISISAQDWKRAYELCDEIRPKLDKHPIMYPSVRTSDLEGQSFEHHLSGETEGTYVALEKIYSPSTMFYTASISHDGSKSVLRIVRNGDSQNLPMRETQ